MKSIGEQSDQKQTEIRNCTTNVDLPIEFTPSPKGNAICRSTGALTYRGTHSEGTVQ